MKRIVILAVILLLFIPTVVYAQESYKLVIDDWHYKKDAERGVTRNLVTLEDFIYYSFYDAKSVTLTKDGKNYSMTVPANKYTSESTMGTGTVNMPKITYKGTEKVVGTKHTIELDGTIAGKPTSKIVFNNGQEKNVTFTVTKIEMDLSYYEEDVKNGKVEAEVEGLLNYTEYEDLDKTTLTGNDERNFYIKAFEISGLGGKGAAATTTNTTAKNTTTTTSTKNTATTNVAKNSTAAGEAGGDTTAAGTTTDEIPVEDNSDVINEFPVGPVVGGTVAVITVGGIGIAIKKNKIKTVKDSVTGEEKNYIYNDNTGEYESEDGKTVLNTSMEEEFERQKIKTKEFMDEERNKMINRETEQDAINKKMAQEMKDGEKALEREIYIDKIGTKNGISSSDPGDIRKGLEKVQERNVQKQAQAHKTAENWNKAVEVAETVEEAADIAITIGETAVPGGKAVSATYKAVKSVASTAAEHGMDKAKLANAAIKGLADAGTTYMSGIGKAATTVGAEIGGDVTEAVIDGKSAGEVWEAAKDATVKGVTKATVNATADAMGDIVGEETANVGGYLYQKHVADPKVDEALKKAKGKK